MLIYYYQGRLEVNSSVLIGSFLVGFRHTDHFHGNGLELCIFSFRKPANFEVNSSSSIRRITVRN